jgi:hypothetical protein
LHLLTNGPLTPEQLAEDLGRADVRSLIGDLVANRLIRRLGPGVALTLEGFERLFNNPDVERLTPETLRAHLAKPWADTSPQALADHFHLDLPTIHLRLDELGVMELSA